MVRHRNSLRMLLSLGAFRPLRTPTLRLIDNASISIDNTQR